MASPAPSQDGFESDDDSDQISDESLSPADRLWEILSVDLDEKLREELKPEGLSSNNPENLDKLRKALHKYQESHFDSVLRESKFSNQNQTEIIASTGTCDPTIYCDRDTAGLVCFTKYRISVTNSRRPKEQMNLVEVTVKCRGVLEPASSVDGVRTEREWKVTEYVETAARPRRQALRSIDEIIGGKSRSQTSR